MNNIEPKVQREAGGLFESCVIVPLSFTYSSSFLTTICTQNMIHIRRKKRVYLTRLFTRISIIIGRAQVRNPETNEWKHAHNGEINRRLFLFFHPQHFHKKRQLAKSQSLL